MSRDSELTMIAVDPLDDAAVDAWHATYDAAQRIGRDPEATTIWTLEEIRADLQSISERRWTQAWSAVLDGEVVTAGFVTGSNQDNLKQAEVFVATRPESRGRGHGRVMLDRLEGIARVEGRSVLDAEIAWRWDADPMGVGVPDVEWAGRYGYRVGLVDVKHQLALPVADDVLDRLIAETAPHHGDYTIRSFVGPVPDELLQGWVELSSSLMTEAPMGDLEREPEAVDLDGHREDEAKQVRQGRSKVNTIALTADGEAVAYSDLALTVHEPDRAYQWGTLVRRDHRGHRLGMAVKLANLRLLQEHIRAEGLGVRRLITYNAEVNAHMVDVNSQLGFVPVERLGELQKRL